jgi:hypothetical protein
VVVVQTIQPLAATAGAPPLASSPSPHAQPAEPMLVMVVTPTLEPAAAQATVQAAIEATAAAEAQAQATATREAEKAIEQTKVAQVRATEAARYPDCPLDLSTLPDGAVCTALPTAIPTATITPFPNCSATMVAAGDRCSPSSNWFPPTSTPYPPSFGYH